MPPTRNPLSYRGWKSLQLRSLSVGQAVREVCNRIPTHHTITGTGSKVSVPDTIRNSDASDIVQTGFTDNAQAGITGISQPSGRMRTLAA